MEKQDKYINFLIFGTSDGPSEKLEMEKGLFFVGKTIHIPFDKHFIQTGEDSKKPGGMFEMEIRAMNELGIEIAESGFIPLGQTHQIERYETIDVSKCDVSILYRMPCRSMTIEERVEYGITSPAKVIPFGKKGIKNKVAPGDAANIPQEQRTKTERYILNRTLYFT